MASPESVPKYDSALLGILQHEGELEPFLDVVFGFLFRKTDFFHVITDQQKRYGFPDGVAEKLIQKKFKKYKTLTEKLLKQAENQKQKMEEEANKSKIAEGENRDTETDNMPAVTEQPAAVKELRAENTSANAATEPEVLKTQEEFQSNPESYNGAVRDKYSWSQNYDDIDIIIPVSKSIVKGRQVKVNIERKRLFVSVTGEDGNSEVIIDGELKHEIMREESMWSLETGKNIQITLTKDTKYWWNALLTEEEEIDIKKITPERSMADMPEDEVAVINKLQFDENQKRRGLPQSHEIKVHEMLKKGWNAEGSPFKGQDFDPKMFNVSPGSVQ